MIRLANKNDLKQIAQIHRICFPNSMTTKIGRLELFYNEYLTAFPDLFFLATDEGSGKAIGFCVGYMMSKENVGLRFTQQNKAYIMMRTILFLLKGDKDAWKKSFSKLFRQQKSVVTNQRYIGISSQQTGDLLSICVLPEYRGCGIAGEMIELFVSALENKKMKRCILTVDCSNYRGISFYKKHGFVPYREISRQCITFARLLADTHSHQKA